jgi:hypothetical protein
MAAIGLQSTAPGTVSNVEATYGAFMVVPKGDRRFG